MKKSIIECENCRRQVNLVSDNCPYCGARFNAVSCARCGFTGDAGLFGNGCPKCGAGKKPNEHNRKSGSKSGFSIAYFVFCCLLLALLFLLFKVFQTYFGNR